MSLYFKKTVQVSRRQEGGADRDRLQPADTDGRQHQRRDQDVAVQQHETVERELGNKNGEQDLLSKPRGTAGFSLCAAPFRTHLSHG